MLFQSSRLGEADKQALSFPNDSEQPTQHRNESAVSEPARLQTRVDEKHVVGAERRIFDAMESESDEPPIVRPGTVAFSIHDRLPPRGRPTGYAKRTDAGRGEPYDVYK